MYSFPGEAITVDLDDAVFSEACQINADRVVWEGEDV